MKYKNNTPNKLNKFKKKTHKFSIRSVYHSRYNSPYDVVITYKPIVKDKCTVNIINRETEESMLIFVNESYYLIESRLNTLYKEHLEDLEELENNRQRRIKHVEAIITRKNQNINNYANN